MVSDAAVAALAALVIAAGVAALVVDPLPTRLLATAVCVSCAVAVPALDWRST